MKKISFSRRAPVVLRQARPPPPPPPLPPPRPPRPPSPPSRSRSPPPWRSKSPPDWKFWTHRSNAPSPPSRSRSPPPSRSRSPPDWKFLTHRSNAFALQTLASKLGAGERRPAGDVMKKGKRKKFRKRRKVHNDSKAEANSRKASPVEASYVVDLKTNSADGKEPGTRKRTKLLSRRRAVGAPAAAKEATAKATALREEEKAKFDAATADLKTDVTAKARDCKCPGTSEIKRRIKIAQKALNPTVVKWTRPSQKQCKRPGCIYAVLHPEDHDKVWHRRALKTCDWRLEFCCASCSVDGSHGRLCMRACSNCGLNATSPAARKCKFPSTEQHAQFLRDGRPLRIGYSSSSEASNLEKCVWDSR